MGLSATFRYANQNWWVHLRGSQRPCTRRGRGPGAQIADYNLGAVYTAPAANRSSVTKLTISGGVTLDHPVALAFDPSGNLYIGDTGPDGSGATATNPGFIVKVPVGGGTATKLSYTISGAPVIFPQALATDTAGNLYIADAGDGQTNFGDLVVVPANTGTPSYISTGSYTLSEPAALGFDPALNLYVLDGYNARVLTIPVTLAATTGAPELRDGGAAPANHPHRYWQRHAHMAERPGDHPHRYWIHPKFAGHSGGHATDQDGKHFVRPHSIGIQPERDRHCLERW